MNISIEENKEALSKKAFEILKEVIVTNPHATLGLATGSTPTRLYQLMVEDYKKNQTSYHFIKTLNLDEYVGLDPLNLCSYHAYMATHLFNHVDILLENTYIPNGNHFDLSSECLRYNALSEQYPRDLQILGLGNNGHIGFNEPNTSFDSTTRVVDLTTATIHANARFFQSIDEVPKQAITLGIANIMKSKKIILLAYGKQKAKAVKAMIEGEISTLCPASVLRKHPDVHVIIDQDAAHLLTLYNKT